MTASKTPPNPVMIIDDEEPAVIGFEMTLRAARLNHFTRCLDSREALGRLSRQPAEVILLDLRMPHLSGEALLTQITARHPEIPVIVITGINDVETAVACMQKEAFDYIVKPVEQNRLISAVRRALEIRALQRENERLKAHVLSGRVDNPQAFAAILTVNAAMQAIFRYVEAVAASPRPVLIMGETGVGKELIAQAVHTLSPQAGAFVAVNVAGLDDAVFADTLFGHRKGAFTDAAEARNGLVEQAAGGTLFLDEIGDLSTASQVKLLRLLQDGTYYPLGSDVARRSDTRILVATNQDLEKLQAAGRFRRDLYYRLCAHRVHIPPLRDRKEDLPLLVDHFLAKAAATLGKKRPTPPTELYTLLASYHFPGNVRELEALIFDAVSGHAAGKLSLEAFKAHIGPTTCSDPDVGRPREQSPVLSFARQLPTLKQAEDLLIAEALQRADNNQSIAALSLGISRQALNKRLLKDRRRQSKD